MAGHPRSTVTRCASCERDANGRIKSDPAARRAFQQQHPCPGTGKTIGACPGYVVDHVVPLKRGGADSPENMQWQTVAEAKAKDRIESLELAASRLHKKNVYRVGTQVTAP